MWHQLSAASALSCGNRPAITRALTPWPERPPEGRWEAQSLCFHSLHVPQASGSTPRSHNSRGSCAERMESGWPPWLPGHHLVTPGPPSSRARSFPVQGIEG